MMANVPHVTSGSGLRKFQADGFFFFDRVYKQRCVPFLWNLGLYPYFFPCVLVYHLPHGLNSELFFKYLQMNGHAINLYENYPEFENRKLKSFPGL